MRPLPEPPPRGTAPSGAVRPTDAAREPEAHPHVLCILVCPVVACSSPPHLVSTFLPRKRESRSKYPATDVLGQQDSSFGGVLSRELFVLVLHSTSRLIGEGNGTPLQYPCLENPTDGGAW